jgi:hypothetical protein
VALGWQTPVSFLATSKSAQRLPFSVRLVNETRLRRSALLQSARNGARFESILATDVEHFPKFRFLEKAEALCTNFPHARFLFIALISGLFAAGVVVILDRVSNRFQPSEAAYSEAPPAGITDPSTSTDEQNNMRFTVL